MAVVVKLKAGQSILVAAIDPDLGIGGGPIIPDFGLGTPEHPIVLPPDPNAPIIDNTLPGEQPIIDNTLPPHPDNTLPVPPPIPTHPIVLPPEGEVPPPIDPGANPNWKLVTAWTPVTGWVVVAVPQGPHVTPSKKR